MSVNIPTPGIVRCCKIPGGGREHDRIDVYTLLEMKGLITGLEATGANTCVWMLKRLLNRCIELEARELERTLSEPNND